MFSNQELCKLMKWGRDIFVDLTKSVRERAGGRKETKAWKRQVPCNASACTELSTNTWVSKATKISAACRIWCPKRCRRILAIHRHKRGQSNCSFHADAGIWSDKDNATVYPPSIPPSINYACTVPPHHFPRIQWHDDPVRSIWGSPAAKKQL